MNGLDIAQLDEHIWLGSAQAHARLAEAGFTHVVDLRIEADASADAERSGLTLLRLPWGSQAALRERLEADLDLLRAFVAVARSAGGKLLIHCASGVERTALAAYVLLRADGLADAVARRRVRQVRPLALWTFIDGQSYAIEQYLDERGLRRPSAGEGDPTGTDGPVGRL